MSSTVTGSFQSKKPYEIHPPDSSGCTASASTVAEEDQAVIMSLNFTYCICLGCLWGLLFGCTPRITDPLQVSELSMRINTTTVFSRHAFNFELTVVKNNVLTCFDGRFFLASDDCFTVALRPQKS